MMDGSKIDYGPLTGLIGTWTGDKGMDIAPEPDGTEQNPFFETIIFTAIGDVTNAESQDLSALHYRQIVSRHANGKVFHDETGYWMWDPQTNVIMHSFVIPRGVAILAGGDATRDADGAIVLKVAARVDDPKWGIIQSPFMQNKARTTSFTHMVSILGDTLSYKELMMLEIYGSTFEHTDENQPARSQ